MFVVVSQTRSFAGQLANIPCVIASGDHSYGYERGLEEEREGSRWGERRVWGRGAITRSRAPYRTTTMYTGTPEFLTPNLAPNLRSRRV